MTDYVFPRQKPNFRVVRTLEGRFLDVVASSVIDGKLWRRRVYRQTEQEIVFQLENIVMSLRGATG